MLFVRVTESFEPAAAFEARFPGWSVIQTAMLPNGATEQFFPDEKTIFMDPSECGLAWAYSHIAAHLILEHDTDMAGGEFTEEQERQASWLAAMRMDYRPAKTLMALPQQPLDVPRQHLGFHALEDFDEPPSVAL